MCWFLKHPSFVGSSSILNTIFHSFSLFTLFSPHVILHDDIHLSHSPYPRKTHRMQLSPRQSSSQTRFNIWVKDGEMVTGTKTHSRKKNTIVDTEPQPVLALLRSGLQPSSGFQFSKGDKTHTWLLQEAERRYKGSTIELRPQSQSNITKDYFIDRTGRISLHPVLPGNSLSLSISL